MDRSEFGLKPIEMELWHGFIFLRFLQGPQPAVAELLKVFDDDLGDYRAEELLPAGGETFSTTLPVNWKSVRDVDNEGYHVAMAHPALQDLYGRTYRDLTYPGGLTHSIAEFGDTPGRRWSVRNYLAATEEHDFLPKRLRNAWTYYGMFPSAVIAFTPESAQVYYEVPLGLSKTRLTGRMYRRGHESRRMRAARYLAFRIDRETSAEDQQMSIWSNESMKSSAFEDFHLSDLEIGVRRHHDQLRRILPVTRLPDPPDEAVMRATNENLYAADRARPSF
jgi:phenylpropionate dioxygenase-like ring-hydroxylating dioxygenase large terminal subunit